MSTETSLTILVVILSITLALFLLLGIVLLTKLIKLSGSLQRIADKAEQIADKAEATVNAFQRTSGLAGIGSFISNIADAVNSRKKK